MKESEFQKALNFGLTQSQSMLDLINFAVTWEHNRISCAIERGDIHPVAHDTCFTYCINEAIKFWNKTHPEQSAFEKAANACLSFQKALSDEFMERVNRMIRENTEGNEKVGKIQL